jgi:S-adenosylmethionine synthetase
MTERFLFTSESVSEGHPDKVADQISDAILDICLKDDPKSRVACETLVKNDTVVLAGEITSKVKADFEKVTRDVIREIGYTDAEIGFSADTCDVLKYISQQSSDISMGVNEGEGTFKEQGAGDQGIMFGYACDETPELMPLPISLAHKLTYELACQRKSGKAKFLRPDAKSQVTIEYVDGRPEKVHTVVVSSQHSEECKLEDLQDYVVSEVVKKIIPENLLSKDTIYFINPTGRFVIGGPVGDCGLTGRKIIVDTYGGYSRHGGGAFSGKDPSKVDRSAAYASRHIAKNVVAAGLAKKCEVQLAYAIGVAKPVSILVNTFGTGKVRDSKIADAVQRTFELTPQGIIREMNLLKPIYQVTASYGHFGREPTSGGQFSWERLDKVKELQALLG